MFSDLRTGTVGSGDRGKGRTKGCAYGERSVDLAKDEDSVWNSGRWVCVLGSGRMASPTGGGGTRCVVPR